MINSRKKILIFSTAYLPLVGGAEIAVKEITDRLGDYDFDLITARLDSKLPKKEVVGRVNVYRIGLGCSWDKFILMFAGHWLASKLHQNKKYDAIWAIMASFGGLSAVRFKKKYSHIPFLLTLQEGDNLKAIESKTKILGSWWRNIFLLADSVQCISNYLAVWSKEIGVAPSKVAVVPNGVDTTLFFNQNLNLDHNFNLVTTSRLVYKNGLDLIIKALPLLPETVVLHIAGVGPEEDNLKELARKLGVLNRVVFNGLIPYEQLPQFLATGRIFIRPSRSEGLGNSFLEAMAVGLPIVAPLVGGIPDFLEDCQTGLVIEAENPIDIVDKIKWLLDDDNKLQVNEIRLRALAKTKETFSWGAVASDMNTIFDQLVDKKNI